MNPKDITLVTAVDEHHMKELQFSYRTWIKNKPEILDMPMLLIFDKKHFGEAPDHPDFGLFKSHPNILFAPWDASHIEDQRERMLTSLVILPGSLVETPWYLKIDTDTVATSPGHDWINPKWFVNQKQKCPVIISHPWGYTKPRETLNILDKWGDSVHTLKNYPSTNVDRTMGDNKVYSRRIISWVMFCRTDWSKRMASPLINHKLPVPSQDTFLWYCAKRRGDFIRREHMNKLGWNHFGNRFNSLKNKCKEILS